MSSLISKLILAGKSKKRAYYGELDKYVDSTNNSGFCEVSKVPLTRGI